ncbi:MAG: mannitol dehydrogenase family protein [Roseibium sp.]|uniref:mannitol dehydrogenase family protein n=1 Tax=Roseibium sp. TaxID=1936156 RepID=UPI001B2512D4|nr:mannitol dehydrogenase family protein [Roseibium sp.]MBO6892546.1 mannitol dehydrogenase family protein [Roseibium sp.]MBO6930347.1 mannitol dehydrogenase family protein [Roseibium sp.]
MTQKLGNTVLHSLPDNIAAPRFDRANLSAGILHIGVGNFHRAHQAMYLNRLFELGEGQDWAIVGAGLMPYDRAMRDRLKDQDWLTTVVELAPEGLSARVCASMIDFVDIDPAQLVARLGDPAIRIVSLTITEGGYFVDPNTGGFDATHPDILADLHDAANPRTVFGALVVALLKRKAEGIPPFTIMSCDNLPENGHIARQAVVGYARAFSPEAADWIAEEVAFPSGMVDCITPATGDRERSLVAETFDLEDAAPVVCEPFRQWVLEDNFPTGRPALEKVGVEFVDDVAPYELMKLRILNGGHAAIAYPAALLGHHFVHDAMADPLIRAYLRKLELDEILPTVPEIPGVDFETYLATVLQRFSNAAVGDTIPRLCLDGSNRQPKFILPAIKDRLDKDQSIDGLALETALWCRYCLGRDEAGNSIEIEDENSALLRDWASRIFSDSGHESPQMPEIFGSLASDRRFLESFSSAAGMISSEGVAGALSKYLATGKPVEENRNEIFQQANN